MPLATIDQKSNVLPRETPTVSSVDPERAAPTAREVDSKRYTIALVISLACLGGVIALGLLLPLP